MGQVGRQLPFAREELHDLVGHRVERHRGQPQFGRSLLRHPGAQLALPQLVRALDQTLRGPHHAYAQPVGDRDRSDDQRESDAGEDRPGRGEAVGDLRVGDVHLDDGDLSGAQRDRLEQRGSAGHLAGRGAAQPSYGRDVVGGGALPAEVDGGRVTGGRYVHGHARVRPGRGDDPLQLVPVGGDGQGRGDGRGLPLGVGEGTVAGHFPDDEPERDGEGDHDHGGDRQTDLDQCPPHRGGSPPGGSSFTPTPRRVCR